MRMPLLSYFLVVGTALTAAMAWLSFTLEPASPPITVSHAVGLPAPFKAPVEVARAPAVDEPVFAMVPMPAAKPTSAKTFALAAKPVKKVAAAKPAPRSRIAEYPHGLFNFR